MVFWRRRRDVRTQSVRRTRTIGGAKSQVGDKWDLPMTIVGLAESERKEVSRGSGTRLIELDVDSCKDIRALTERWFRVVPHFEVIFT